MRSFIGCPRDMRQTIRGLGFRRMQQVVEREDTPAIRGMIAKVHHLVEIQGLAMADEIDTFEFKAAARLASP